MPDIWSYIFCAVNEESHSWWLLFTNVIFFFSFPAHLLILSMAVFHTPRDMFCYKMTVSNTTFWSTLVLVWSCGVLRPVILFPYPMAISYGPPVLIRSYSDAMFHFNVLIILTMNMLMAMIVCFTALCLYLLQSPLMTILKKRQAVGLAAIAHLSASTFGWVLLNKLYIPNPSLRRDLSLLAAERFDNVTNTELTRIDAIVRRSDGILFGYTPFVSPPFMSFFTWVGFTTTAVVVLLVLFYVIRVLFRGIQKSTKSRTWRFKRNVFFMLASRTTIPLIFGFVPTIILTVLIWLHWQPMQLWGNILFGAAMSQALINCTATIAVFRPYRRTFIRVITACLSVEQRQKWVHSSTMSHALTRSRGRTTTTNGLKIAASNMLSQSDVSSVYVVEST